MTTLPDPTSDLDWSGFVGAIHDIFSANAKKFPDRPCVVETVSETSPRRDFSYRQIYEASNILAHYLVRHGIVHGDVVMVYAYRGVDLVVAVMGVLKAGATFSVIDPLYPPERQKIYLEVAQPKALVNIAKATLEAGQLSHTVRSYVNELNLKAEVPALRLTDDGYLEGGLIQGRDVFTDVRTDAFKDPDVLVGPDSNPTLSFTSGSEGRPKGVLGRHFSLAYYFPWMKERFGLNEQDRFTMLSGIAHDPIQRDIFTPLFLGAQLIVPAREDIQHERLAEWMKDQAATVTHLTPAMGQILVGGASAEFPALKRAFFVGDVLTKRDCNLLRNLAPNVNIVNMYGTTETQRAVSYFEIPNRTQEPDFLKSLPDIMPAGRGMHNVQLLVVDRTDRTKQCAIGEVGEIYVRAGGLAEHYLGDKALNDKKFLVNWFVDPNQWIEADKKSATRNEPWRKYYKGPRDRLYRTGDLGRYLQSGDVECIGRSDDQVKIRGFRIELGDINSHLSQHPLIRDSVTLVRRDKDEEPTLVSYIVPELKRWPQWLALRGIKDSADTEDMVGMLKRFRPLQNEVRTHLKRRLPSYAVPTFFIPMIKLPLNPNGKIDKAALPFPDIVQITAAISDDNQQNLWTSLTKTERMVATVWGELIPGVNARVIKVSDSFFDLGGHSILAQQMLLTIRRNLGYAQIPVTALFVDPSLQGFSNELDRIQEPESPKLGPKPILDDYAADAERLKQSLAATYPTRDAFKKTDPLTVFLTGASGFLGTFLLRDLLERTSPPITVIAHVRAKSSDAALLRLKNSCAAYGVWHPSWASRLICVTGNLGEDNLSIDSESYKHILENVDVVIHNGAQVHWVYPYSILKLPNVKGTIDALKLCASGKAKKFVFVSSTSVLDNDHYVELSEKSLETGGTGVLESDDLQGSKRGLSTGYGQSKWVGEYLVRLAGTLGLSGAIIRPGYILGDSRSGVTNTDDFLIRMLKGCVQLSSRPHITNTINMVPVDHVARVVVATAFSPLSPLGVVQITSHPRLRFEEFLSCLSLYGYNVPEVNYHEWRSSLENYVNEGGVQKDYTQHALMPLYHFVTNDLPANTKASELDDRNAVSVLKADAEWTGEDLSGGSAVTKELVGRYLKYLVITNFLEPPPEGQGEKLPDIVLTESQKEAQAHFGGRGGVM